MRHILLLTIFLISNSCLSTGNILTDKQINKTLTTESSEVKVTTSVKKYSPSKKWFYGKIKIENKTDKDLGFNFNQNLKIKDKIIKANCNFKPVSYALIAFRVSPKTTATWDVVWEMDHYNPDSMEILIVDDLKMTEFKLIE